jgi:hypothetical protein
LCVSLSCYYLQKYLHQLRLQAGMSQLISVPPGILGLAYWRIVNLLSKSGIYEDKAEGQVLNLANSLFYSFLIRFLAVISVCRFYLHFSVFVCVIGSV